MGRKRNQGKARRAAKVKAREEAAQQQEAASGNNNPTANNERQQLSEAEEQESSIANELLLACQVQQLTPGKICSHGFNPYSEYKDICLDFISRFSREFDESSGSISACLIDAKNATLDEFSDVWNDSVKMKIAISIHLCNGAQAVLENKYDNVRDCATIVRYLEQDIAVRLVNWPKVTETYAADEHTLVKFFRRRIPCSCLDEKYEEVKHITKMGFCYNPQCKFSFHGEGVERSKAKYCSRCRVVTYCSRECQEACWSMHKPYCEKGAARIAEFEAKQQNM